MNLDTMILARWKSIFAWLPVETIVKQNQQEYYNAIARSDAAGDSTVFILFMLKCLQATIKHEVENKVDNKVEDKSLTDSEQRIVKLMTEDAHITIAEICKKTKLSAAGVNKILASLRNKGTIKRIGANKNGYWDVHKK